MTWGSPPERWRNALAELDAAHIGTIHSLCAQILRVHPVEAARLGHLPGFGVLLGWLRETLRRPGWQEARADEVASGFYWHIGSAKASSLKLERFEGGVPGAIEAAVTPALSMVEAVRAGEFAPTPPPDGGLLRGVQSQVVVRWKNHHHD